jgi:L-iditol 2-dehydrogenase
VKVAILHGKENIRIEEVVPQPLKPGEVRIQIAVALTCGTDLKVVKRGYHAKMLTPPSPFGHELAGTISEIAPPAAGRASSQWHVGDHVVVANSAPCGHCFYCENNQENLCDELVFLNGAYAETIAVPARFVQKNMLKLKPGTDFEDAALAEPLACVVQGVEDLDLQARQNVLVIGTGPIGLMFIALAKHLGCSVSAAGRGSNRLRAALRLGADVVFDVGKEGDVVKAITKAGPENHKHEPKFNGAPAPKYDVVIEAVGKPETWQAAIQLVRKGGAVNFFGGCPTGTTVALDTHTIHYSNLRLLASFHHTPQTFRRALDFIQAGVIQAKDFVDGQWPLTRLPELFKQMAAGNSAIKTLVNVRA